MTDDEKELVKNVYIDKAKIKLTSCIVISILGLLSYVIPLIFGNFDFGLLFEITTLVFIFIARYFMTQYDDEHAKKFVIIAMIPIGWLFIYDLITALTFVSNVVDLTVLGYSFFIQELLTVLVLSGLYAAIKDLKKADNPEKYKESTDWFYERINEIKEEDNNK